MKRYIRFAVAAALLLTLSGCGIPEEELPAVLFCVSTDYPQSLEDAPSSYERLLMRDGTVYAGSSDLTVDEIAAQYEAGTLTDHYTQMKCGIDPDDAAAQYHKLCRAAKSDPALVYPEAEPAVEEPRTYWYTYIPQEDGTWKHVSMGEDFCGSHYPSESKEVNEVYEWLSEQMKG